MADLVGQELDQYRLIHLLGAGAFGEVYLGEHIYEQNPVAIKVLKLDLTPDTLKDFLNEARTFRLKHPHIVQLLDFGIEGNTPFLVMDYAPHGTLRQRHPQGTRLSPKTILPYVQQVAAALQYAHDKRLIHRDVKPQNILLGYHNEILLSDFGIAAIAHSEHSLSTQEMVGTIPYMAPEQIKGKPRPASDQYALGIIVYEWLCGVRPFQGAHWEIVQQHLSTPPPPLREKVPSIHPAIEEVVLKALAKDPKDRFESVQQFAAAFEQACQQWGTVIPSGRQLQPIASEEDHKHEELVISDPPKNTKSPAYVSQRDSVVVLRESRTQPVASLSTPINSNTGAITVDIGGESLMADSGTRTRNTKPWWIAGSLIILSALVISGAFAYIYLSMFSPLKKSSPGTVLPATVTIVPDSQVEANSYVILAVPGTLNAAQSQVSARALTSQTVTQTKLVTGTGHNQVPASTAKGQLLFINGAGTSFTVAAGTLINAGNGISVITDGPVTVPAGKLGVSFGTASVSAHASDAGKAGNIPAGTINQTCCTAGNSITVKNVNAFTGGQDAQGYSWVQPGDVDAVVSSIKGQLDNQANASLTSQLKQGEQLAGSTQCPVNINTDQQVGDTGQNVPSLNVTVSETCKGEAYDQKGMQTLVSGLLQNKAQTDLGPSYQLVGNIIIHSKVQSVNQDNTVSLLVDAKGLWVYQFTDAQKQALAKSILGKNSNDAVTILKTQKGVDDATVQVSSNLLPNDPGQISIVIQNVPGLIDAGASGGATPGATSTAAPASTAPSVNSPSSTPAIGKG